MSASLQALREQLRERFPQAHIPPGPGRLEGTGVAAPVSSDLFPEGALSEIVPAGSSPAVSGLLIARLLGEPQAVQPLPDFILVDGCDSFDPASFTAAACSRLLWVRCQGVTSMLRAADLVVRDGNVPFVLVDACGLPRQELARIPDCWQRLKRAARSRNSRVVVLSSFPVVPCASLRLRVMPSGGLQDFSRTRRELLERLELQTELSRHVWQAR